MGVVAQVVTIETAKISVGERLRPVDQVWARALAGVIAAEGQKTPIEVCLLPGRTDYLLVTGAHRLAAAKIAGMETVLAVVVGAAALDRLEREISENLWRLGLGPIDRASFIAELIAVQKQKAGIDPARSGQSIAASVRWQKAPLRVEAVHASHRFSVAYRWADGVADQIGLSRKTVYADLALYRGLAPDVGQRLRGTRTASRTMEMRALARFSPGDQRSIADLILDGSARGVAEAAAIFTQKPRPNPEAKTWNAFFGAWGRMSARQRLDALAELRRLGLPRGASLTLKDADA